MSISHRRGVVELSVIVPTYNAGEGLEGLFSSLKEQSILGELIVIDSSSTDDTPEISKAYADTFLSVPKETFDHGGTRTEVAKIAKGDILIFLTQDVLPVNKEAFTNLLKAFENPSVGAVYGRQIPYESTNHFGKYLRVFNYPDISSIKSLDDKHKFGIKTAFLSNSFAAYKKSALQELGWFKDGLIVGEDVYMGAKLLSAGYSLGYEADALVYHSHSYSLLEECKRYFDIGVFYKQESWLLETFGKVESEGKRFVLSEMRYLLKHNPFLIPVAMVRTVGKYVAYKLGQQYKSLPMWFRKKCSMHKSWWSKQESI